MGSLGVDWQTMPNLALAHGETELRYSPSLALVLLRQVGQSVIFKITKFFMCYSSLRRVADQQTPNLLKLFRILLLAQRRHSAEQAI